MADGIAFQSTTLASPASGTPVATREGGTTGQHAQVVTTGGNKKAAAAAGASSDTVVSNSKGTLGHVIVIAPGSNAMEIYDNASAGSGTKVGIIPAFALEGKYEFHVPVDNGITIKGDANNPAVTVVYAN